MAFINRLWLATLTSNEDQAGSEMGGLNLSVNINGFDVFNRDVVFLGKPFEDEQHRKGQTGLQDFPVQEFDSVLLTNSSIRVGIRVDDAWRPQHVFLFGSNTERRTIALAMETDIVNWLSTDFLEGKLTIPLRLVSEGHSSILIRRVMLLVNTGPEDSATNSPVQLQIMAGGNLVLQEAILDTAQNDFEEYTANWYFFDASLPFTRGDVLSNGGISIRILGTDAWIPKRLFVYGLDTASGRPNVVVDLVAVPEWNLGTLSTDPQEGEKSIPLPVI